MKHFKHIIYTLLYSFCLFVIRLPLWILGFIIVPFALLFAKEDKSTLNENGWSMKKLPKLFWIWGNDKDGCYGDHAGRWMNRDSSFKNGRLYLNQFVWCAWRNPVNNLRHTKLFSCKLSQMTDSGYFGQYKVNDRFYEDGYQLVWVKIGKLLQCGIYYTRQWGNSDKGIRLRIGFKIKPNHDNNTEDKGFTTSFNPIKNFRGTK